MAKTKKAQGRRDNRTGAIYKDGDGYRVQILLHYDPGTGKPVYKKVRAKTHALAVKELAALQHSDRLQPLAAPSHLDLATYVAEWLENRVKPSKAPMTHRQYKWILETHVVPTLGKKLLDHVTRRDVQALVSALARQPVKSKKKEKPKKADTPSTDPNLSPATTPEPITVETRPDKAASDDTPPAKHLSRRTIQSAVTVLHTAYEAAIHDGLASKNPAEYVDLPPANNKQAQFLTPDQVAELNKKLEGSPIKNLVRFMLATGTRIGEATGVRWEDVDLKKRFVRIAGQLQRIDGKLTYRPTTKTNQDRTLPLPGWLAETLKELKGSHIIVGEPDPDGIVFLNDYGRRFDQKTVHAKLAEACKKAKIPTIGPHKLRHTAATIALMETGDLHSVQMMLGHQQVALTANLYGHAIAEGLRPTLDALGKSVRPPAPDQPKPDEPQADGTETAPTDAPSQQPGTTK